MLHAKMIKILGSFMREQRARDVARRLIASLMNYFTNCERYKIWLGIIWHIEDQRYNISFHCSQNKFTTDFCKQCRKGMKYS